MRYNDLFLKIAVKRHGRYFSFQNEMDRLVKLRGQAWAPQFKRKIERHRYTIFIYRFYEIPDLKSLLETGQLSPDTRSVIVDQLHALLAALEQRGIVHRDITPANILFDTLSERVMLIDFQWARDVDNEIQVASPQEHKMLTYCLSVAGGRYRKPGDSRPGFEQDRFSVEKIIAELEQPSDAHP